LPWLSIHQIAQASFLAAVGMSQPGVSRHLRILHDAGVVSVRPEGQRRLYSLRRKPFPDVELWMEDYRDLVESDREASRSSKRTAPRRTR
jgi:DNA-binding transcriptional ArsR family regulator